MRLLHHKPVFRENRPIYEACVGAFVSMYSSAVKSSESYDEALEESHNKSAAVEVVQCLASTTAPEEKTGRLSGYGSCLA